MEAAATGKHVGLVFACEHFVNMGMLLIYRDL